ncbi:hypothetical protein BDV34DRAFT_201195 [Aspergillus parasiticus]|uniref:Uncharacterized protein n=1 Tax=Aspergillus parasiticus TaxID=5067 RepID=A0A5N6DAU0_ASPPA|nr:hypothetical protein BDV34DRAFT_201195 [Aspergillus parasiticus]
MFRVAEKGRYLCYILLIYIYIYSCLVVRCGKRGCMKLLPQEKAAGIIDREMRGINHPSKMTVNCHPTC